MQSFDPQILIFISASDLQIFIQIPRSICRYTVEICKVLTTLNLCDVILAVEYLFKRHDPKGTSILFKTVGIRQLHEIYQ